MLPIEQGRHLQLPRHRLVCKLCSAGALGDERHLLLEGSALISVRTQLSQLITQRSGVVVRGCWLQDETLLFELTICVHATTMPTVKCTALTLL